MSLLPVAINLIQLIVCLSFFPSSLLITINSVLARGETESKPSERERECVGERKADAPRPTSFEWLRHRGGHLLGAQVGEGGLKIGTSP